MAATKDEVLDFSQYLLAPEARVELDDARGEPLMYGGQRVAVRVYTKASKEFVAARQILENAVFDRVAGGKRGKNAEDTNEANIRFLTKATIAFENFPYPGGAEAIYREPRLFYIADQVKAFLDDSGKYPLESETK